MRTIGFFSLITLGLLSSAAVADDVCYSARVRASKAGAGTVILEETPVGRSLEEAKTLGLKFCQERFPERRCKVAGYALVDCPSVAEGPSAH
jgi:hypothetical protein